MKGGEGFFCIVQCCGAEQNVMPQVPVRAARGSCGRGPMEAVEASGGGRGPMEAPPLTLSGAKQRSLSRFSLKRVFFFTQHIPFQEKTKTIYLIIDFVMSHGNAFRMLSSIVKHDSIDVVWVAF